MNNKSLWWYAHTEVNKRWSQFNKTISTKDMMLVRYIKNRSEQVQNEVQLAMAENLECDRELRERFLTI